MICSPLLAKQYFPRQRWSAFIYWETRGSLCEMKFATQKFNCPFWTKVWATPIKNSWIRPSQQTFLLGTYSRWRQMRIPAWSPLMVPAPWYLLIVVDNFDLFVGPFDNGFLRAVFWGYSSIAGGRGGGGVGIKMERPRPQRRRARRNGCFRRLKGLKAKKIPRILTSAFTNPFLSSLERRRPAENIIAILNLPCERLSKHVTVNLVQTDYNVYA